MATSVRLKLDHIGIVVPDLHAAMRWFFAAFGYVTEWSQPIEDAPGFPFGMLGTVTLGARMLAPPDTDGPGIELHQWVTPSGNNNRSVYQTGIGHIAFSVPDLDAAMRDLKEHGVDFYAAQTISKGDLAGRKWVYGRAPEEIGRIVIELCQHPTENKS